ncbi:Spondin-2 [Frankliniella fusca]|uniref:Spondin-2 n=1 Tax=Frankliniella fusca TaxID=407009 RepID=A0AAE1HE60_9NEOP|nr:Spondin-2 [Frankliniella fusca]
MGRRWPLAPLALAALAALLAGAGPALAAPGPLPEGAACQPDKLTVYKMVMHTFWSRDRFPKHYPDWRPPAQWSKVIGPHPRTSVPIPA